MKPAAMKEGFTMPRFLGAGRTMRRVVPLLIRLGAASPAGADCHLGLRTGYLCDV
jgi:hypothetical protein